MMCDDGSAPTAAREVFLTAVSSAPRHLRQRRRVPSYLGPRPSWPGGPIWLGLAGLSLSGVFLAPDTSAPLTVVKLVAVLVVALNGLSAATVQRRLLALNGTTPPRRLLVRAVLVATISQAGWWTATLVGFLNAQP
jgi:hypothetical protein